MRRTIPNISQNVRRKLPDKWNTAHTKKPVIPTNVAVGIWEKRVIELSVHAIAFSHFDLQNPYKILIN